MQAGACRQWPARFRDKAGADTQHSKHASNSPSELSPAAGARSACRGAANCASVQLVTSSVPARRGRSRGCLGPLAQGRLAGMAEAHADPAAEAPSSEPAVSEEPLSVYTKPMQPHGRPPVHKTPGVTARATKRTRPGELSPSVLCTTAARVGSPSIPGQTKVPACRQRTCKAAPGGAGAGAG